MHDVVTFWHLSLFDAWLNMLCGQYDAWPQFNVWPSVMHFCLLSE